jgi:hypothetical protein
MGGEGSKKTNEVQTFLVYNLDDVRDWHRLGLVRVAAYDGALLAQVVMRAARDSDAAPLEGYWTR